MVHHRGQGELRARKVEGFLRSPWSFPFRPARGALAALAALLACGCSSHSAGPSPISGQWVHVQLQAQGAAAPQAFQATVAFGQDSAKTLVCPTVPSAPTDSLKCVGGGFDVFASTAVFDVTLRSSGNAFLWTSVQPNADSTATLVLVPLAPAQINGDYATGFDGDACLDTAQQFSVSFSTDAGLSYSVKFYIQDIKTQPKVYFLNTKKHPLHYDFAQAVLGVTGSATEFAQNTYSGADRTAMGGTLIFYPSVHGSAKGATPTVDAPWTLNFFPSDDLTPEQARLAHRLIEERITCLQWTGPGQRLVYLPAGTVQEQQAGDDASAFLRRGIDWMDHTDLYGSLRLQALNPGLAYGTLKRMSPDELDKAVISFRDVLLLTRLPNELPIVGGTITEEFQTPLAHCNIAAHTRGTPNLAYPRAYDDPSVSALIGKLVRFEVKDGDFSLRESTLDEAETFWNSRVRDPYVPVFDATMTGIPSFANFGFADSVRVGVKAANLAELSHVIGENAPQKGLAIPFHYYDTYMSSSQTSARLCDDARIDCATSARDPAACQSARNLCLAPGATSETFSAFINRVLDDPTFKVDTALRDAVLANLRYFIEHTPVDPDFGNLLDRRIAEVFQDTKVKIRSSTNCEDLPNFSGAGLYNSYGAHASGTDAAHQVVLRVFSSVWSFRGFEERSFWNIDHKTVRMGCDINEAFTNERANGVLITENIADPTVYGMYVNVQKGNAAVTNPVGGALPEIFSIVEGPEGIQVARQRLSSLSPIPILSDSQVATLYQAAAKARSHFASLYGIPQLILDMEFKLTAQDKIVFKQVRPYRATP
jgi:pyruvate, water dikinase